MLIFNVNVHCMDQKVIENGFVQLEGGKIASLGPMALCPTPGPGDVDGQGGQLYPGWIDAHCHLGLLADGLTYDQDDCNEESDPVTPQLRAIDALYPLDKCFQEAREGGVTTVLTGPGSANAIGGQFAAIKTAGRWIDAMVVKAPVAMKFALGENPKGVYSEKKEAPMTRMAQLPSSGKPWPRRRNTSASRRPPGRTRTRIRRILTPSWKRWFLCSRKRFPPTSTLTARTILPPPFGLPKNLAWIM